MGFAPRSCILDPVRLRSDGVPFRDQSDSWACMHVHVHGSGRRACINPCNASYLCRSRARAPHRNTKVNQPVKRSLTRGTQAHRTRSIAWNKAGVRGSMHGWKALWQGSEEDTPLPHGRGGHFILPLPVGIRFSIDQPYLRLLLTCVCGRWRLAVSSSTLVLVAGLAAPRCSGILVLSGICGGAHLYSGQAKRSNNAVKGSPRHRLS
jgi:hypothetical protein